MSKEFILAAIERIKNAWKAAKTVARGGSVPVVVAWTDDPYAARVRTWVRPGEVVDVTSMRESARDGMKDSLKRQGLELAEPGDPRAFLVRRRGE